MNMSGLDGVNGPDANDAADDGDVDDRPTTTGIRVTNVLCVRACLSEQQHFIASSPHNCQCACVGCLD